ncbi:MAG: hypothetical protein ACM3S4_04770 [Burkholderiales bacterium]
MENIDKDPYQKLFNYYLTLGLVAHRKLTREMRAAIDVARRRGDYTWNDLAKLLYRHSLIVKLSEDDGEYAVRKRGIAEFFGQKIHNGTVLICSEYADDGAKWLRYKTLWKRYLENELKRSGNSGDYHLKEE